MKLVQQEVFSPIAIVLETREEAEDFWQLICEAAAFGPSGAHLKELANKISDAFSNEAHL